MLRKRARQGPPLSLGRSHRAGQTCALTSAAAGPRTALTNAAPPPGRSTPVNPGPTGQTPALTAAQVIGRDREKDVAVLQLLDVPRQKAALLRPVAVGSSSELLVGQRVGARASAQAHACATARAHGALLLAAGRPGGRRRVAPCLSRVVGLIEQHSAQRRSPGLHPQAKYR